MIREPQGLGRVVPQDVARQAGPFEQIVEHLALSFDHLPGVEAARNVGHDDQDAVVHVDRDARYLAVVDHRLLDEEDAAIPGTTNHQMLRPLKDELPAQMAQADDIRESP